MQDKLYLDDTYEYPLNTVDATLGYTGKAVVKEFTNGSGLEITITLSGEHTKAEYYFPAHLHRGPYEPNVDSPMVEALNGVDARPLKCVTILEGYSIEDLRTHQFHIKVHLADSGPEAKTILVAGNIGGEEVE
ncbi:hypothetical protein GCM10007049_04200 [Echinicola pacifica]|uniref:CHRD domain-containing protein n=1 Tax=Echinicola pacifica TaxID=346377 RepID=A0A918PLS1_9BACT|nr:hypothetical protein GCM10007049_04200 [Echinicola pacifica]